MIGIETPHYDPLIIGILIKETYLLRVLVNIGASIDILYWDVFKNLKF